MGFNQVTLSGVCRDCSERHLACHDHCERYKAALDEWTERKRLIKEEKSKENRVRDYEINRITRMKTHRKTN